MDFLEVKGPIGMSFDAGPTKTSTVVNKVDSGKPAARQGIRVDDQIVELRWIAKDDDGVASLSVLNTTGLNPTKVTQSIIEVVTKEWWPLTFVVYRAEKVVEKEAGPAVELALRIVEPMVVRGRQELSAAVWSTLPASVPCDDVFSIVLAEPVNGCGGQVLEPTDDDGAADTDALGRIVLGKPKPKAPNVPWFEALG